MQLLSFPIRHGAKHFAEHKRNEVQSSGHSWDIQDIKKPEDFFEFLEVDAPDIKSFNSRFTFSGFVKAANAMAKFMKNELFPDADLLVFKSESTGNNSHRGHVTDTECRPDYIAVFEKQYIGNHATLWPCIRLVGEKASKGKTLKAQKDQAISYLYYLLLARPDLNVAQGLFTTSSSVMFLFGIGGVGIRTFEVTWNNKGLDKIMYAFFYRLYKPGNFADPTYLEMVPDLEKNVVTYTVQITTGVDGVKKINCPGLFPIYATNPFGTRTHILSNPNSDVKVHGKPLTVLKDQLCRVGTRFDEYSILTQIHQSENVPGVVEAVHHDTINILHCTEREKHRIGLRQLGRPFTTISTLQQMLEIVFDLLEVLRYLRFERWILHRDISKGNVLYFEDDVSSSTGAMSDSQSCGANETVEPKEVPLCFIKYLLGESDDPRKTSVLLIDFNHGEDLNSNKQDSTHMRIARTGTPLFMARAVEMGGPVTMPLDFFFIPGMPGGPEPYVNNHPDRMKNFPATSRSVATPSTHNDLQWRHELDHDTESVFWLLFYWAVGAQPEGHSIEHINPSRWAQFLGTAEDRNSLVDNGTSNTITNVTHSFYKPLWPLLNNLAAALCVDRNWLESSDKRNDPGYLNEFFQRLILQFISDHRKDEFMKKNITQEVRSLEQISGSLRLSHTSGWMLNGKNGHHLVPQARVKRSDIA